MDRKVREGVGGEGERKREGEGGERERETIVN